MGGEVKFEMKVACKSCPFRKEDGDGKSMGPVRLRVGRIIEIHNTITNWHGGTFSCHKTVDYAEREEDEDDDEGCAYVPAAEEHHCAGALGYVHNLGSDGAQFTKFAVYQPCGTYEDYGPADEVFNSLEEWKRSADDYDEGEGDIESCNTVGPDCIAPAGFMTNGGVTHGTEAADGECSECSDATCSECLDDGLCGSCAGYRDRDDEEE